MGTVDISSLSLEERLRLMEQLWESLIPQLEAVPLPRAQVQQLDHRLDALDREGPSGIPRDEVQRQIRSRGKQCLSSYARLPPPTLKTHSIGTKVNKQGQAENFWTN